MTVADDSGPGGANDPADADHHPRGTFFLMLLFLALIAGMWIWMYVILLQRG